MNTTDIWYEYWLFWAVITAMLLHSAWITQRRRRAWDAEQTRLRDLRKMTPEEQEAQRRSFAYGNATIDNPAVTRELVDEVAEQEKKS
jgi:type VI protein secretion system component VasK